MVDVADDRRPPLPLSNRQMQAGSGCWIGLILMQGIDGLSRGGGGDSRRLEAAVELGYHLTGRVDGGRGQPAG